MPVDFDKWIRQRSRSIPQPVKRTVPDIAASTPVLRPSQSRAQPEFGHGPGTELKKLLSRIGIRATANCSCNARAAEMDRRGADWCRENLETIVGWLKEEADRRRLPFSEIAARQVVRLAIRRAEKRGGQDKNT